MRLPLLVLPLLSGCVIVPYPGKLPPLDRDTDLTADTDATSPDTDGPSDDDGGPTGGGDTDIAVDTDPAPDTVWPRFEIAVPTFAPKVLGETSAT